MDTERLLAFLAAVGHVQRLRIIAELFTAEQDHARIHVSELARRLGLSRPLLYMHLERLESAGLVAGNLELSEDGKAMKYFELVPFGMSLDAATITAAVRGGVGGSGIGVGDDDGDGNAGTDVSRGDAKKTTTKGEGS